MAEETANAVTNSDNSIANTLDPIVEITQADTLDAFRLSFNTMANLVNESITNQNTANLDHTVNGGNLWFGNTFVMRGPNGQFAAGDITCDNIYLTGDIQGTINYISDDDESTMIKVDGVDESIDDETIKFYAGGTADGPIATLNNSSFKIGTDAQVIGNANLDGEIYFNGDFQSRGNTTFLGPVKLPEGTSANTEGLEGQFRRNTEFDVVQLYTLTSGWSNIGGKVQDLTDTDVASPQPNEVLTWNGSAWIAQVVSPVGTSGLGDLADIDTTTYVPQTGDRLVWDGAVWKPGSMQFDELTDVDLFTIAPLDGQVLHYRASTAEWIPNTVSNTSLRDITLNGNTVTVTRDDSSIATMDVSPLFTTITQFADVHTDGLTNNSILVYNSDISSWVAGQETSAANTSTASGALGAKTSAKANTVTYYRADGSFFDVNFTNLIHTVNVLGDVDSTGVTHHQVLQWESSENKWKPGDVVATNVDLSTNLLTELSDVDLPDASSLTDKYALKWNATTSKWSAEEDVNDPSLFSVGIHNDVDTSNTASPTKDLYLRWNPTNSMWFAGEWSANDIPELRGLKDVNIGYPYVDHPNHGQVLKWNSISLAWEPADDALTEIGSFGLDRLADVDVITNAPQDGQVLKYDSANSIWYPVADDSYLAILDTVVLDVMNDVDTVTNGKSVGDVLRYDGTQWTAHTLPLAPNVIADIADVSTTVPMQGQVLKYDTTAQEWQPQDEYSFTLDLTSHSVFELMDVDTSATPQVGSLLEWNGTGWQAVSKSIPQVIEDLGDVANTTPTTGQVLKWSGADWYPADEAGATGITDLNNHSLSELSDVLNYGTAQVNDALTWDGTTWRAQSVGSVFSIKDHYDVDENTNPTDEQVLAYDDTVSKYVPTNVPTLVRAQTGSNVPTGSTGSSGDRAGDIAVDAGYFYVCTTDYDGTSDIWKRISFASALAAEDGDTNW